jgi:hypothetical protein
MSTRSVPDNIVERFLQANGWGSKLARPAKEVELLNGMDNQGWMPHYMGESLVEGDNLRLMQSVLGRAGLHTDRKRQGGGTGWRRSGEQRSPGGREIRIWEGANECPTSKKSPVQCAAARTPFH